MKVITAKELKNRTGEALRWVREGEKVMVTVHGKPRAVLSPAGELAVPGENMKDFDQAWREIEKSLGRSKPRFKSWREAVDWSRGRG